MRRLASAAGTSVACTGDSPQRAAACSACSAAACCHRTQRSSGRTVLQASRHSSKLWCPEHHQNFLSAAATRPKSGPPLLLPPAPPRRPAAGAGLLGRWTSPTLPLLPLCLERLRMMLEPLELMTRLTLRLNRPCVPPLPLAERVPPPPLLPLQGRPAQLPAVLPAAAVARSAAVHAGRTG